MENLSHEDSFKSAQILSDQYTERDVRPMNYEKLSSEAKKIQFFDNYFNSGILQDFQDINTLKDMDLKDSSFEYYFYKYLYFKGNSIAFKTSDFIELLKYLIYNLFNKETLEIKKIEIIILFLICNKTFFDNAKKINDIQNFKELKLIQDTLINVINNDIKKFFNISEINDIKTFITNKIDRLSQNPIYLYFLYFICIIIFKSSFIKPLYLYMSVINQALKDTKNFTTNIDEQILKKDRKNLFYYLIQEYLQDKYADIGDILSDDNINGIDFKTEFLAQMDLLLKTTEIIMNNSEFKNDITKSYAKSINTQINKAYDQLKKNNEYFGLKYILDRVEPDLEWQNHLRPKVVDYKNSLQKITNKKIEPVSFIIKFLFTIQHYLEKNKKILLDTDLPSEKKNIKYTTNKVNFLKQLKFIEEEKNMELQDNIEKVKKLIINEIYEYYKENDKGDKILNRIQEFFDLTDFNEKSNKQNSSLTYKFIFQFIQIFGFIDFLNIFTLIFNNFLQEYIDIDNNKFKDNPTIFKLDDLKVILENNIKKYEENIFEYISHVIPQLINFLKETKIEVNFFVNIQDNIILPYLKDQNKFNDKNNPVNSLKKFLQLIKLIILNNNKLNESYNKIEKMISDKHEIQFIIIDFMNNDIKCKLIDYIFVNDDNEKKNNNDNNDNDNDNKEEIFNLNDKISGDKLEELKEIAKEINTDITNNDNLKQNSFFIPSENADQDVFFFPEGNEQRILEKKHLEKMFKIFSSIMEKIFEKDNITFFSFSKKKYQSSVPNLFSSQMSGGNDDEVIYYMEHDSENNTIETKYKKKNNKFTDSNDNPINNVSNHEEMKNYINNKKALIDNTNSNDNLKENDNDTQKNDNNNDNNNDKNGLFYGLLILFSTIVLIISIYYIFFKTKKKDKIKKIKKKRKKKNYK